ncbi:MAG: hypothetical protein IJ316_01000 [Clostridia bacterium]|nr:hypothetical protein [Clostridia bacterium]
MKERKLPFMGGTIVAIAIIVVFALIYKFGPDKNTEPQIIDVEPTERPTLGFLPDTEIINLPTE